MGFTTPPWQFFAALAVLTLAYLVLVEITKKVFYADPMHLGDPRTNVPASRTGYSASGSASRLGRGFRAGPM